VTVLYFVLLVDAAFALFDIKFDQQSVFTCSTLVSQIFLTPCGKFH